MKLIDLISRNPAPEPWSEGEKIPWNDLAFSKRMLKEHLSQAHDLASRRFEIINQHVSWIHNDLLDGEKSRILDLGCGPGFYANRLAKLGHSVVGIDFSPVSIEFPKQAANEDGLDNEFHLEDIRNTEYGGGFGLAMMLYGEFNTFCPSEARNILKKMCQSMIPDGILLLEVSSCEAIYDLGEKQPRWYAVPEGLFSERPHICLMENFYDSQTATAIERFLIIDLETSEVTRYASSLQAYTHAEFQNLLNLCGFHPIETVSFFGTDEGIGDEFFHIVCRKESE